MNVSLRVSVRPPGPDLQGPNLPHPIFSPQTPSVVSVTNISFANMYSPIVGRIYPIPTDILSSICIYLYWINTICRIQIFPGPNLPHPNFFGAQSAGAQFAGAQSAGAQFARARFAKKWQIGPQKERGPICRQIGEWLNLPGPNLYLTLGFG